MEAEEQRRQMSQHEEGEGENEASLHCNKYLGDFPKVTKQKVATSPQAPLFR